MPADYMEKYKVLKEEEAKYGAELKEGDILIIEVKEGAVSFSINGVNQGIAFTGVILPKVNERLYIEFEAANEQLTLLK